MTSQVNFPVFYPPESTGTPVVVTIHPARGQSNARYGCGVGYDIVFKANTGDLVRMFPDTRSYDLMKKYEWVWIEATDGSNNRGWVSLLIPIEKMFISVKAVNEK